MYDARNRSACSPFDTATTSARMRLEDCRLVLSGTCPPERECAARIARRRFCGPWQRSRRARKPHHLKTRQETIHRNARIIAPGSNRRGPECLSCPTNEIASRARPPLNSGGPFNGRVGAWRKEVWDAPRSAPGMHSGNRTYAFSSGATMGPPAVTGPPEFRARLATRKTKAQSESGPALAFCRLLVRPLESSCPHGPSRFFPCRPDSPTRWPLDAENCAAPPAMCDRDRRPIHWFGS